jgi:hypothetical protein
MNKHRASFWSGLIAIALAFVCFCAACWFQSQSRRHDSVQAGWMFYAAFGVFVFSLIMAARHRFWFDWLAAAIVAGIAWAIPNLVLWVI